MRNPGCQAVVSYRPGFGGLECSYANQFPGKTRRLSYANIPESILENSNDGKMKRLEISMPLDG
jgi:hypothetical protein